MQGRLAKQGFGALLLQHCQAPQQGLAGTGGHQGGVFAQQFRVIAQVIEQCLEVLEVQQQQAFAVGHFECRIERRLLAVGEFQQAAEQQRAHFTDGGAQWVTGLAVDIPQGDRVRLGGVIKEGHTSDALGHFALRVGGGAQAAEVALDVGSEHRHTRITEGFCQALQGDGLAGARGASDQPMTVGQAHGLGDGLAVKASTDKQLCGVRHFVTYG